MSAALLRCPAISLLPSCALSRERALSLVLFLSLPRACSLSRSRHVQCWNGDERQEQRVCRIRMRTMPAGVVQGSSVQELRRHVRSAAVGCGRLRSAAVCPGSRVRDQTQQGGVGRRERGNPVWKELGCAAPSLMSELRVLIILRAHGSYSQSLLHLFSNETDSQHQTQIRTLALRTNHNRVVEWCLLDCRMYMKYRLPLTSMLQYRWLDHFLAQSPSSPIPGG